MKRVLAVALTALALGAFTSLGFWQLARGQARQLRVDAMAAPQAAPAMLSSATPAGQVTPVAAQARGTYLDSRQLLLDGQAHDGVPGYQVLTPLKLPDGTLVIVNRGWVPQPAPALIAPAGEVAVQGLWHALPKPGIRLEAGSCAAPPGFPAVVQYPRAEDLRCLLGATVLEGELQLDAKVPGGFVRDWTSGGFPPARHYAYAAQWFGLALVAAVMLFRIFRGSKT